MNSQRVGEAALNFSRAIPPWLGYRVADLLGGFIASRKHLPMVRAVRANQWVINGGTISGKQLDQATKQVWQNIARAFYFLFHAQKSPDILQEIIVFDPLIEELIRRSQEKKRGVVAVGVHMSYFDSVLQATTRHGLRAVTLGLPGATEAINWQTDIRRQSGLEVLPATTSNLREIIRRLEAGETFITGADYPTGKDNTHKPLWFGRPAQLPTHYVHVALRAQVPVVLLAPIMRENGRCQFLVSDYIEMRPGPNRETEILENTERILEICAGFIRQAPQQWSILQPVWPEALQQMM
ncbi:MAG: hypothetical protein JXB15_09890 [Anaerolineales bacterium]|nr:hypothetical protein [Anaerolineales bacterium]